MKSIKRCCMVVMAAVLGGCGADAPSNAPDTQQVTPLTAARQPIPTTSGTFRGHYVVPVPPNLVAAARYPVDEVEWSVEGGIATLRYYLPVGLVGGPLEVEFHGPLPHRATAATLQSADGGTATCTALGTTITCHEVFGDLGALPISMSVVRAVAAQEYAGPVEDRVAVANLFPADPIGFVDFDVALDGQ